MGDEYLRRVASELKGYCRRPTDLLAEADARLYQAKRGGRNRVCSS